MTAIQWSVKIGGVDTPTDFSSRTIGASIDQPLDLQRLSLHSATITLLNNDGELTPTEAGGTGTYANVDWFAQALFIDATVSGTVPVFHGLIDGFELQDDGVNSTVTITAVDGLTLAGRAPGGDWSWVPGDTSLDAAIVDVLQALDNYGTLPLNVLGETSAFVDGVECTEGGVLLRLLEPQAEQTIADYIATNVMATNLSYAWATTLEKQTVGGIDYAVYNLRAVGDNLNRIDAQAHSFSFVDANEVQGSTDVVFSELQVGYLSDRLVNWVQLTSAISSNTRTYVNQASVSAYGATQYTANAVMARYDDDFPTALGIRSGMLTAAETIANRLGSIRFTPLQMSINSKRLESTSSDSEIETLLDVASGLWNRATITRTPTGGSKISDIHMISGRRLNITPEMFTLELSLVPAVDYQVFILDDSSFGVLDQNRLGLDTYI